MRPQSGLAPDLHHMRKRLPIITLKDQFNIRLIPAVILEPRIRLVDGGEVITGPAFDLAAMMAETRVPHEHRKANPGVVAKALYSIEASRWRANRFNRKDGPGAYYAATALPAAIEEIRWHLAHDEGVPFDRTKVYRAVTSRVSGKFVDLRAEPWLGALNPDPRRSYPAGARFAEIARERGLDGIIYRSVRHNDGTCLAIFHGEAISDVRLSQLVSFERDTHGNKVDWHYRVHMPEHLVQRHQQHRAMSQTIGM